MEIHALRVSLTEEDLNRMLGKQLAKHQMVKDARLRVVPEGLHFTGVLRSVFEVPFESTWLLAVRDGKLAATLAVLKALGLSANLFKATLLRFVADAVQKTEGVHIDADTIVIDLDHIVSRQGMNARVNLVAVIAAEGSIVVEAGTVRM